MTTKKEVNKKISELKAQYRKLKKALADAGYDIENPKQAGIFEQLKLGDIISGVEGTVLDFINSYNNKLETLTVELTKTGRNSKTTTVNTIRTTEQIKDFSKVIRHLNKQIIDALPEREKAYEEVSMSIQKEREEFEKTYGQYSSYSKQIQSELNSLGKKARNTKSLKELTNVSKQVETLRELLIDNFKDTAERTDIIRQIDKQKQVLDREIEKRSGFIKRSFEFLGKHKLTIGSLAAGVTANNPLVMWAVEALGEQSQKKKQLELKQKGFRLEKLLEMREDFETLGGRAVGKKKIGRKKANRIIESRYGRQDVDVLKELKRHSEYFKQLIGQQKTLNDGEERNFSYQKESDEETRRTLESTIAASTEAKLEQPGNKPGKETKLGYKLEPKERFQKKEEKPGFGIMDYLAGKAIWTTLTGKVVQALLKSVLKYVVLPIAAFGTGYAIGSWLKEKLPENIKNQINSVLHKSFGGIEILWNRAKLFVYGIGDMFANFGAAIDKFRLKVGFIVYDAKAYINKALGMQIFDEKQMDAERNWYLQQTHKRAVERNQARKTRNEKISSTRKNIQLVNDATTELTKQTGKKETGAGKFSATPEGFQLSRNPEIRKKQQDVISLQKDVAARGGNINAATKQKMADLQKKIEQLRTIQAPEESEELAEVQLPKSFLGPETGATNKPREMQVSEQGLDFIKKHESFQPKPYWDVNGYAIGYGSHTMPDGSPVTPGDKITEAQADTMLRQDVNTKYTAGIKRNISKDLTQEQFDALASLSYNAGPGAVGEKSRITRKINAGDMAGAEQAIQTGYTTAGGIPNRTLAKRRLAEANMFGSSKGYIAANDQNQTVKLAASNKPQKPIVIANNNVQHRPSTTATSANTNRAAPRGNEPALQTALNTDFSGSSA